MVKLLKDYKKYTSYISGDPLFNLNCFLLTKDPRDKTFFTEFTQGQNFRQFLLISKGSKQFIAYFEFLSMHYNMMMEDHESGRCHTENNITVREFSFFKAKKLPNLLNKFFAQIEYLPASFSQDFRLQDKNTEYYLMPYFINSKSINNDFNKLETLTKCNVLKVKNEVFLFDAPPQFKLEEELPNEVRLYNLHEINSRSAIRKTRTFKRMSSKRAAFKIKDDHEDEYTNIKKSSTMTACSTRFSCKYIYNTLDMRKTSLLSVITDTIDHEDLESYRENIIEQIKEFLTAILTSSPLKSNYNSEIKILFTFRPARSEFAQMIYQEKFKSVKIINY
jgi:hypothetical protein